MNAVDELTTSCIQLMIRILLWSPVLVPLIAGGSWSVGPSTERKFAVTAPLVVDKTRFSKSKRSWHMLVVPDQVD